MSKDIKKLYIICSVMLAVLLAAIAIDKFVGKIAVALIFAALATLALLGIRKRTTRSLQKKEVLLIVALIGIIYVIAIEVSRIFFSFYENPYFIKQYPTLLITRVIPYAVIIISSEIIRSILLVQKGRFAAITSYFVGVMSETLMFYQITQINSLYRFMDLIALTLFPAVTTNIYYHYLSRRFGALPNIAFRLITSLYIYFLPTRSAMSDALLACIKMVLPFVLLAIISSIYEKKKIVRKNKKLGVISILLTALIITPVAMLISCQFHFGALVIATESMTGEINKGDIIIYERYDSQPIEEGQVIVFLDNQTKIVHRVVKIQNLGGEIRYYTKGDANDALDVGYRTQEDIFGVTDIKLACAGYPTLWLRELFNSNN